MEPSWELARRSRSGLRIVTRGDSSPLRPGAGRALCRIPSADAAGRRRTGGAPNGARLATLAIETRRLYTDLRHRSEFDLLTDIHNRFAMEKRIDVQIEEARQNGGIFGLIYIDLDKFKPINDTYGHHVGDLYLQEVALRMSRQLLGRDMLARLGGDEFAALVSLPHGRSDLEKIVARLERCFDDPFSSMEAYLLQGEASIGIALYPEDGATQDSLLSAADAAMYAVKNGKRQAAETAGGSLASRSRSIKPRIRKGPACAGPFRSSAFNPGRILPKAAGPTARVKFCGQTE